MSRCMGKLYFRYRYTSYSSICYHFIKGFKQALCPAVYLSYSSGEETFHNIINSHRSLYSYSSSMGNNKLCFSTFRLLEDSIITIRKCYNPDTCDLLP